ncbi:MAG: hypothetical protein JWM74_6302 [Myxococcaceae bacterium]|nr:hypothetical protein [Myxococcaceae bacterium]
MARRAHDEENRAANDALTPPRGTAPALELAMDAPPLTSQTICGTFPADHRRLEALVEQILSASEAGDAECVASSWGALKDGLLAHFDAEETHLIPDLLVTSERGARVIIGEHRHLRSRLTELGLAIELHVVKRALVSGFVHELRAHARSEERLLYGPGAAVTLP